MPDLPEQSAPSPPLAPWLDDGDVQLYQGDAIGVLRQLPAGSAQTCVTSPPYWGLRDYGAKGQIGLEATPAEYVERLVDVFRAVRRVLRDDGTLWLNLGDSYIANPGSGNANGKLGGLAGADSAAYQATMAQTLDASDEGRGGKEWRGLPGKNLVGIPWRVAFALQADGWYLRSDIVWSKPNPMPESVTDRPTKAHEYVFLLSKQQRYYWDADAIREPHRPDGRHQTTHTVGANGHENHLNRDGKERWPGVGRNARSVWEIATQPFAEAHFATFPEELARRCILAGSSEAGECAECGAPWQRQTERHSDQPTTIAGRLAAGAERRPVGHDGAVTGKGAMFTGVRSETTGWAASCACGAPARPQLVLDPFAGSGTTCLVARKHARRGVGVDLSSEYLGIAAGRLGQQSLFADGGV